MARIMGRIVLTFIAVLVLGYAWFQYWRFTHAEYQTQPAIEYVTSQSVSAKGVAIREETVLEGHAGEDLSYLYTDGAHVSMEMPVARIVSSPEEINDQMKRDALQKELENLEAVAVSADVLILQNDTVAQRVYTDIDTINASAALGDLSRAGDLKYDILTQLNRRSLATSRTDEEEPFAGRIEELKREIESYGIEETTEENAVLAPAPGYFTKTVDGLEEVLTFETMEKLSVDEFVGYINAPVENDEESIGRIITNHIWYYAVVINSSQVEMFTEGYRVELDFGMTNQRPFLATVHKIITERDGARSIIIFECNEMGEELANMRSRKVEISVSELNGYKLPRDCKRYQNDQVGVYVLDASVIRFKPVEILYENEKEDYLILSTTFRKDKLGLERFDEVIIGGYGLKDGKVLKQ
ncbi:MAG: hypothetical protein HFG26_11385 [Provencibacterium sp.]|jgi:putative membrane fusion protein|nr:hypothetical protein [Provencibacterium sp.]